VQLSVGARGLVAVALAGLAAAFEGACGEGGTRHVEILLVAPDVPSGCAVPPAAQRVDLFALGDFVEVGETGDATQTLTTARFPAATRALRLAVLGPGGATIAIGRTGSFDASTLDDGGSVALLIGPPRGFCQVGRLAQGRRRPTVAKAAGGVLVVGGIDSQGGPVGLGEWYDPARGVFELLAQAPFDDLRGARAVTLDDGRVLLVWQDGFQIFDPATRHFGDPTLAQGVDVHSYGQAVKLADGRVLVAGGCLAMDVEPPCAAASSVAIFDPARGRFVPARDLVQPRAGGAAWLDGDGRVVLVGGFDATGAPAEDAEGWDEGASASFATGPVGASAPLAAGGFVAGFAPAGETEAAAALLVGPLGAAGGARTAVVARAGATMTTLDDGAVLVVGGVTPGAGASVPEAELYRAHAARFEALATSPEMLAGRRREHEAVELDDGSVLVLGGVTAPGGEVRGDAWIYRHDVTGPWSSLPAQIFGVDGTPLVLPFDAAASRVEVGTPGKLVLVAQSLRAGPLGGWAIVGGAEYADVTLAATLSVSGDTGPVGVAALVGLTSAGDYLQVVLVPGQVARANVVAHAAVGALVCEGHVVVAEDALAPDAGGVPGALHSLRVDRRGTALEVTLDGASLLTCDSAPLTRGKVGFGVVGAVGSELRMASIEAVR
jgi:hypothetical protein